MPRSDIIMEARRVLVNQRERRLRAGWRLLIGVFLVAFVYIIGLIVRLFVESIPTAGLVLAAGLVFTGWVLWQALPTGCLIALSWWLDGRTLSGLGLGGNGWWRNLGFGLFLGVAMPTAVLVIELALGFVAVDGILVTRSENQFGVAVGPFVGLFGTLLVFVGVGVFEEVLSRGYLFQNIAEGLDGLWSIGPREAIVTAAVVTSAFFGILHAGNPNSGLLPLLNIGVVGLFFAATYVATGDLGIPIGIHITWNFSISSLYGFPVSGLTTPATIVSVRQTGPTLLTGGRFGPEGGLVLYLALAVGVACSWWWVRREYGEVRFRTEIADPDLRNPKRPVQTGDSDE